mmetsp:Transcript_18733/g.47098  ORF Transcript_18733/g.47098 Transcript_18733/m.47098 type:complete len:267 (+) Transcript_18733:1058-1858(+)
MPVALEARDTYCAERRSRNRSNRHTLLRQFLLAGEALGAAHVHVLHVNVLHKVHEGGLAAVGVPRDKDVAAERLVERVLGERDDAFARAPAHGKYFDAVELLCLHAEHEPAKQPSTGRVIVLPDEQVHFCHGQNHGVLAHKRSDLGNKGAFKIECVNNFDNEALELLQMLELVLEDIRRNVLDRLQCRQEVALLDQQASLALEAAREVALHVQTILGSQIEIPRGTTRNLNLLRVAPLHPGHIPDHCAASRARPPDARRRALDDHK